MNVIRITAAALIVLFLLFACHKETEQDRVKKIVTEIQKAAGEKEVKTVLGHLSKTYRDPQGYDYDGIKGLLLYYFFRHQKVSVFIPGLDIAVTGSSAKAVFQAVLSGGNKVDSPGDLIPEALGMYAFDVSFAKESGEWKVTSAAWKKGGGGSLAVFVSANASIPPQSFLWTREPGEISWGWKGYALAWE